MALLNIVLFGTFSARFQGQPLAGWDALKVQELLSYLLLNPGRPHARETLASLLWGDHCTTAQSKSYLRKALWKLQSVLQSDPDLDALNLLGVDGEWIRFNAGPGVRCDVATFEQAYRRAEDIPGRRLDAETAEALRTAVTLYRADLLETWYQDWCLFERERYRHLYLTVLDKLMGYCEATGAYEAGLGYGDLVLRHDRARERTHRHLMRLYYLNGDRTAALRQYQRCADALREELAVPPARLTVELCEHIRADRLDALRVSQPSSTRPGSAPDLIGCLHTLQHNLAGLQQQIQQTLNSLEPARDDASVPD